MAMTKRKARKSKKMGRPTFQPSDHQRKRVRLLKATGMPHLSIAHVIKVAPNTLEKHFRRELDFGAAEIRADLTAKLFELAMSGNVSALNRMIDQVRGEPLPGEEGGLLPERVEDKPAKGPKLGKKEQRRIDAEAALEDPEWAELLQ